MTTAKPGSEELAHANQGGLAGLAKAFANLPRKLKTGLIGVARTGPIIDRHCEDAGRLLAQAMDLGAFPGNGSLADLRARYFDKGDPCTFFWVAVRKWLAAEWRHAFATPMLGLTARHLETACDLLAELLENISLNNPRPSTPANAERLAQAAGASKGMPRREANIEARKHLEQNPDAKARDVAKAIGCALGMVSKLPAWQAVQEQRMRGKKPKAAKVVNLTSKMEAVTGREESPLCKLIAEQEADAEPSPLDDGVRAKVYRRR